MRCGISTLRHSRTSRSTGRRCEPRDVSFVTQVLERSDQCCHEMLDTEFRTITRRILARVAARDPRTLRRGTNVDRCAAGLVWLAGRANGEFGRRGMRTAQRLWDWFPVGSCSDRGYSLRSAAGLDPEEIDPYAWSRGPLSVGDPALLHSRCRSGLIAHRDAVLAVENRYRKWSLNDDGRTARVERGAGAELSWRARGRSLRGAGRW